MAKKYVKYSNSYHFSENYSYIIIQSLDNTNCIIIIFIMQEHLALLPRYYAYIWVSMLDELYWCTEDLGSELYAG